MRKILGSSLAFAVLMGPHLVHAENFFDQFDEKPGAPWKKYKGMQTTEGRSATYSLYRTSLGGTAVYIAAFDADESGNFNQVNCEIARELFAGQQGVTARFWCEAGGPSHAQSDARPLCSAGSPIGFLALLSRLSPAILVDRHYATRCVGLTLSPRSLQRLHKR